MLFYYYKEYPASKRNAIIFAQTAKYEMVYRIRAKATQVFVNESFLGTIEPDGTLHHPERREVFGKIDRSQPYRRPITLEEVEMGTVVLPASKPNVNPRAFEIDEKMDERQQVFFMVLGIYEVINYLTKSN